MKILKRNFTKCLVGGRMTQERIIDVGRQGYNPYKQSANTLFNLMRECKYLIENMLMETQKRITKDTESMELSCTRNGLDIY